MDSKNLELRHKQLAKRRAAAARQGKKRHRARDKPDAALIPGFRKKPGIGFFMAAMGVLAACLLLFLLLSGNGENDGQGSTASQPTETAAEEGIRPLEEAWITEAAAQAKETQDAQEAGALEQDSHSEVNALISLYFTSLASGDEAQYRKAVDTCTEAELQTLEEARETVEEYLDIHCYTKPGLEEGEYIVFATYRMKFPGIETTAPGLTTLYVYLDAGGTLKVWNGTATDTLMRRIQEAVADPLVEELEEQVNSEYNAALAQDDALAAHVESLLGRE